MITVKDFPEGYYLKYSASQATPSNSNSFKLYRSSLEYTKRDENANVFKPSFVRCSNAASKLAREASHLTRVYDMGF